MILHMAIVYSRPGAELQLLRECPSGINCFSDIEIQSEKYRKQLIDEKRRFFDLLPETLRKEKVKLGELCIIRNDLEKEWDEKIVTVLDDIKRSRWRFWKYIELVIKKYISKPKAISAADRNIRQEQSVIDAFERDPDGVFCNKNSEWITYVDKLDGLKRSPGYSGAYGEVKILQALEKLDDRFHVLCDVNIQLNKYVSYNGVWNLRSAQMDFVVVGPTGIYVLEVKNWSSNQVKNHAGLSPHEQVERAGRVLWIFLKRSSFFNQPRVTNLLIPVQGNIAYNPYYRSVLIRNPLGLDRFIYENNRDALDTQMILNIVNLLK